MGFEPTAIQADSGTPRLIRAGFSKAALETQWLSWRPDEARLIRAGVPNSRREFHVRRPSQPERSANILPAPMNSTEVSPERPGRASYSASTDEFRSSSVSW